MRQFIGTPKGSLDEIVGFVMRHHNQGLIEP
jgi:hypothetical protein